MLLFYITLLNGTFLFNFFIIYVLSKKPKSCSYYSKRFMYFPNNLKVALTIAKD